jgi:hypothetical protein
MNETEKPSRIGPRNGYKDDNGILGRTESTTDALQPVETVHGGIVSGGGNDVNRTLRSHLRTQAPAYRRSLFRR